ncbi:hypothetical protein VDG1235_1700 [Verrucomicrobiia bacterium DG1235]|nr:hypothetical protein VDG1235_1700 [Verrucomicrobiae bacterium DG1235]
MGEGQGANTIEPQINGDDLDCSLHSSIPENGSSHTLLGICFSGPLACGT